MKVIKIIAFVLTVIGALNWGLVGILRFDLVSAVFGEMSMISRIVYTLVGLSGVITLLTVYSNLIDED
jgi:uncharacterized membrane protein YuzA (DUF378 family)